MAYLTILLMLSLPSFYSCLARQIQNKFCICNISKILYLYQNQNTSLGLQHSKCTKVRLTLLNFPGNFVVWISQLNFHYVIAVHIWVVCGKLWCLVPFLGCVTKYCWFLNWYFPGECVEVQTPLKYNNNKLFQKYKKIFPIRWLRGSTKSSLTATSLEELSLLWPDSLSLPSWYIALK